MDSERVVRLRNAIIRIARQFNATATDVGLTPAQASALGLVAARGPIALAELAHVEHLHPTMVSRVVGKLAADGLVKRVPVPSDLRTAELTITARGARVHAGITGRRAQDVLDALSSLPPNEVNAVVTALPALEALAERLRLNQEIQPSHVEDEQDAK